MKCVTWLGIKVMLLICMVAGCLLLGGCGGASYVWYQAGRDQAAFKQDHLQCEEEAALFAKQMDKRGDKEVISNRMKDCMGVRGYVKVLEEDLPAGAEKLQ